MGKRNTVATKNHNMNGIFSGDKFVNKQFESFLESQIEDAI